MTRWGNIGVSAFQVRHDSSQCLGRVHPGDNTSILSRGYFFHAALTRVALALSVPWSCDASFDNIVNTHVVICTSDAADEYIPQQWRQIGMR